MATEILLNDGGAPARILPFTAGEATTAGHLVCASGGTAGEVMMASSGASDGIGFMFVDTAASGNMGSVITGKGVILNLACTGAVAAGNHLVAGATAAALGTGFLQSGTTSDTVYAIALGALASDTGFVKAITL